MLYQEALTELSGIRFIVTYSFFGDEQEARETRKVPAWSKRLNPPGIAA